MSATNRPKRSKSRNESGIHGKHYERKVLALITLKCLLNRDIKDFWLLSNPEDVNKFDDIILFTEHRNGNKKLFLIQVKHRSQGTNHPVIAGKLDGNDKDLALEMYQKAFFEINENTNFLEANDVCSNTEMVFILFNNCKVTNEKENENIGFESTSNTSFKFIDTSKSSGHTNIKRIINKSEKYDQNFLERFYFFTEQLNLDSVNNEIGNLLGINDKIVEDILKFFYSWAEPKDECIKLCKIDIKMKLLDIVLGEFQPPRHLENVNEFKITNMISKFDTTIITRPNSSIKVWSEVFHKMKCFCEDFTINFAAWEECIPKNAEDKLFSHFKNTEVLLMDGKNITLKFAYIFMVAQRKIPFFIKNTNKLFDSFKSKLLPALDIYSVVFNVNNEDLQFLDDTLVFQDLNNIEEDLYFKNSKKLMISFQGKSSIELYPLMKTHKIEQKVTVDSYIELLHKTYTIGEANKLPTYYVNRKINVPVTKIEIIKEKEFNFFIFQTPREQANTIWYKSMHPGDYFLLFHKEITEYVITTHDEFSSLYLELIERLYKGRVYYIFQYINSDSLSLIHTNGSIDVLRPYLNYICKEDIHLYNIQKQCNINIICNNAGMGKSTFLNFISSTLPVDEWAIYIDLKKYRDTVKKVKTMDELVTFSYNCQNEKVDEELHNFFQALYKNLKHKIVWLIDDYEEINEPRLLDLFKLAGKQGYRIWIVTRPLFRSEFENAFGKLSLELTELDEEDQTMFTNKYLKYKNKNEDAIGKIMTAIKTIKHLLEDSFIGTCQQTMMLTEIFLNYENSWNEHEWRVHDIYEKFILLKVRDDDEAQKQWYIRTISKLALKVFFKDNALRKVFDLEEFAVDVGIFKNQYRKDFFITEFGKNDVPIFSHKTYAEFLAARWLLHTVEKQMKGHTPFNITKVLEMLYVKELTTVRLFFDNMLTKHLPLHSAIVNKEEDKIRTLISTLDHYSETDLLGRSIFHLVSSYGNYFDIGVTTETNDLIRNLDDHSQIVRDGEYMLLKPVESVKPDQSVANIKRYLSKYNFFDGVAATLRDDSLLKLNCIGYALLSGSLLELNELLQLRNVITTSMLPLPDEMKYCLLFHCIQNRYHNILLSMDIGRLDNVKVDPFKRSLLHLAVVSRNEQAVQKLVKLHSLDDWGVDEEENTPLHNACDQKDDSLLKYFSTLTDIDVDFINKKNIKGESHLYILARRGHTKWVKKIIQLPGIKIDSETRDGNTPFMVSVIFHKIEIAKMLHSCGAAVDHTNNNKKTALHFAASKGFRTIVKILLKWEANVNQVDDYGMTPLMKASIWNHKSTVMLLLINKAKVNLCDRNKWSALHHAVRRNNSEIVALLLKFKANVNCRNKKGETPLMIACKYNSAPAVKLLIDCNITTHNKKLALKISIKKKHLECTDLLFQAGITL